MRRTLMLRYDPEIFPDFENYLYNVKCQLLDRWVNLLKTAPDGTKLEDIPGQQEAKDDITRFEFFCKKYLGYGVYPKGHKQEYQFHYLGDEREAQQSSQC